MTKEDDDIQQRLIALTRDMILIPSISSRQEDRQRCYEFIKNHLDSLGTIEAREFSCQGIPSLVAGPPGCRHPEILLCGHMDVIAHPDISVYRSQVENGRIIGPGAGDMKGSLAVLLEVFRQVHTKKPNASLAIAVTADEEVGGKAGIGYLVNKVGLRCHRAMIPDGGALDEVTVEEKGILHLKVTCRGHSAHAARPWLGNNPIEHLMARLARVKESFDSLKKEGGHWFPTCSVTIVGTENQTTNRIAEDAFAVLDVRFTPPGTVAKMLQTIKDLLQEEMAVEVLISAEPARLSPDPLYLQKIKEVTGKEATLVKDDGGSDARYLAAHNIPVMMSRPWVGNLHAVDEWIDISSMVQLYHIYESYLMEKLK